MKQIITIRFSPVCALCILFLTISGIEKDVFAAETNATITTDPQVKSNYSNGNNRPDPFLPVRLKGKSDEAKAVFDDRELRLQGILWHPTNPVAIVNRQRVFLNESVTLKLSTGETTVKALKIERDRVVLKIDNRQVELQIDR